MTEPTPYVTLPHTLVARQAVAIPAGPLDEGQFAAHELEFVRCLFGYSEYLRTGSRETPVSDAFLSVLVMLLETIDLNAPLEARRCAAQLKQIVDVMFPDLKPELSSDQSTSTSAAGDAIPQ